MYMSAINDTIASALLVTSLLVLGTLPKFSRPSSGSPNQLELFESLKI